jgi:signal transduction histidine kinase
MEFEINFHKSHHLLLAKRYAQKLFSLLLILLISCNSYHLHDKNHPEIVEKALSQANIIKYAYGADSSIAYLDSVYNKIPDAGILDRYQKYEAILRMLFSGKPDYARASHYADSIQHMIIEGNSEKKYQKEFAKAYFFQGDISKAKKNYDEAFNFYFQGKVLVEKSGDSCAMYQYFNKIGNIYFDQHKYKEAGQYYMKTSEYLEHCGEEANFNELFVERQGNLCNVGICYMGRNMPDSALYYYNAALDFITNNEHKYPDKKRFSQIARAVIRGHMGDVYLHKRQFSEAETLLKNSIAINDQRGNDNKYAQYSKHKLIDLYLQTEALQSAKAELTGLRASLDSVPNENIEVQWYDLASQYFLKNRDPDNAYKTFRSYVSLRDSLSDKRAREADVGQVLDRMEYSHKLELVRKEAELSRLYLLGTISTTFMAMIIAFLIWLNWKRTRNNILELKVLNQQISEHNMHIQNVLGDLEKSQEQNKTMMKIVAHDLRSPIGSVKMAAESMLEEDIYSPAQRRMLEMIHTSLDDSMELIGNLMKSNTQTNSTSRENVALHTMINYCVGMMQYKANDKSQTFNLKLEPVEALIDRERIWRVVSNLISNAIKFSSVGGIITIELRKRNNAALILVQDHGIGIPDHYKDQIFDLYTSVGRTGTSGEQSFGMGLSISKQIIQAHHGKLWFESEQGKGTSFYIELPLGIHAEQHLVTIKQ